MKLYITTNINVNIAVEAIYEANFNFSVVLAKINGILDKKDKIMKKSFESQKVSKD